MLTTREVRSIQVCRAHRNGKEVDKNGVPRRRHKIGKVFKTVFSPDGLRVVGFIVRRPDFLWMIKRPEKFLALDAIDIVDGVIVATRGSQSWDDEAIKRLGINWDTCIIWEGMEVKTSDGTNVGRVDDISFNEVSGTLNSLFLDDGTASRALLGSIEIPAELMVGYKKGALIVKPQARDLLPAGGLAAKAGEASAKVSMKTRETQKNVTEATAKAIEAGTIGVGKAVGGLGRGVKKGINDFKEESGISRKKSSSEASRKAQATKSTSSDKSASEALGAHLKSAGSMFSNFKKEFDNAKK